MWERGNLGMWERFGCAKRRTPGNGEGIGTEGPRGPGSLRGAAGYAWPARSLAATDAENALPLPDVVAGREAGNDNGG